MSLDLPSKIRLSNNLHTTLIIKSYQYRIQHTIKHFMEPNSLHGYHMFICLFFAHLINHSHSYPLREDCRTMARASLVLEVDERTRRMKQSMGTFPMCRAKFKGSKQFRVFVPKRSQDLAYNRWKYKSKYVLPVKGREEKRVVFRGSWKKSLTWRILDWYTTTWDLIFDRKWWYFPWSREACA